MLLEISHQSNVAQFHLEWKNSVFHNNNNRSADLKCGTVFTRCLPDLVVSTDFLGREESGEKDKDWLDLGDIDIYAFVGSGTENYHSVLGKCIPLDMDGGFPLWKSVQPIIYGLLNVEESGNRDASFKFFTVDKYNMSLVYILGLRYVY